MARLLVFCESPADFETATGLVERVLKEEGPAWLRDLFDGSGEVVRQMLIEWLPDGEGRTFFDVHKTERYARRLNLRVPHGHFSGEPGAAGALMARTAFGVARELGETTRESIDAVLLVWDMDDQADDRRRGLQQAREEAERMVPVPFVIVLGCPKPEREAWILAGFEPETDEEHKRLKKVRSELGLNPCLEAHRLGSKRDHSKRSLKRVLEYLTDEDPGRQARCWTETSLELLRSRGRDSGLTVFLEDEVKGRLLPLFTSSSR